MVEQFSVAAFGLGCRFRLTIQKKLSSHDQHLPTGVFRRRMWSNFVSRSLVSRFTGMWLPINNLVPWGTRWDRGNQWTPKKWKMPQGCQSTTPEVAVHRDTTQTPLPYNVQHISVSILAWFRTLTVYLQILIKWQLTVLVSPFCLCSCRIPIELIGSFICGQNSRQTMTEQTPIHFFNLF